MAVLVCGIYNKSSLAKVCELGIAGLMFICTHVYDVALCGNTVRNVALGPRLVGQWPPLV